MCDAAIQRKLVSKDSACAVSIALYSICLYIAYRPRKIEAHNAEEQAQQAMW